MRLCRFLLDDDLILTGFYDDGRVIAIDHAAESFGEETGEDLLLPSTENLLDLLPPDGPSFESARRLAEWVESLDEADREALAVPEGEYQVLVPIARPSKILLLAGNYAAHVAERGGTSAARAETFPYVFMKPITTMTHPGDPVLIPTVSPDHVDWECELGVVIGRHCRHVEEGQALDYVAGYTVINDVTDRRYRPNPGRKARERDAYFDWLHGKWHDSFCPIGPCVASADALPDPQALRLRLEVNGEVKQDGTTAEMVFPVAAVIAFLSRIMTLEPGDLLATGTPSGVGSAKGTYLKPGDRLSASIEGIGRLENPVEAES